MGHRSNLDDRQFALLRHDLPFGCRYALAWFYRHQRENTLSAPATRMYRFTKTEVRLRLRSTGVVALGQRIGSGRSV